MGKTRPPLFRRHRIDARHHPKLKGCSVLARDIFWLAIEASPLGVLEASITKIANECGPLVPGGKQPNRRQIAAAIVELTTPRPPHEPIASWWPALEVLWIRECAAEQVFNPAMWAGLGRSLGRLPAEVQSAIRCRYADAAAPHAAGGDSGGIIPPHLSVQESGSREQNAGDREQGGASRRPRVRAVPAPSGGHAPVPGSHEHQLELELARLRDRLPQLRRPRGGLVLYYVDDKARELLRAGVSVDEWCAVAEAFADAIDRGDEQASDWRANYVMSLGWFERLRNTYLAPSTRAAAEETPTQTLERLRAEGAIR